MARTHIMVFDKLASTAKGQKLSVLRGDCGNEVGGMWKHKKEGNRRYVTLRVNGLD